MSKPKNQCETLFILLHSFRISFMCFLFWFTIPKRITFSSLFQQQDSSFCLRKCIPSKYFPDFFRHMWKLFYLDIKGIETLKCLRIRKQLDYSYPHKLTCICLEFRMALGILNPHIWVSLMKNKWQKRKKANDLDKHVKTYE